LAVRSPAILLQSTTLTRALIRSILEAWFSSIATKLIDVIEEEKNAMIHEQQRTCDEAEALDVSSLAPAVPPWHSLPPDAIKMIKLLNKVRLPARPGLSTAATERIHCRMYNV